ncbi:MAG: PAC2 family protein [Candidatus Promineifilaceae bacterium]|nr:PAC2 family protein [Candidatus Promineifilaceae bacterium]
MAEAVNIWEEPAADEVYMLAGWRQWADAGSISSRLPRYLIKRTEARRIGELRPDGFYFFQIPGTHELVRPVVRFDEGYPESLERRRNEFFYSGDEQRGVVFFVGDEPHMDVERYVDSLLYAARRLNVRRIISFGGVYGELPYDRARSFSSIYSLPRLKSELENLAVNLSDYHGGASIGSYLCRRASEEKQEFVGFYAFVPTYDFSGIAEIGNTIRLENDFMAWLGVMQRVNYMLKIDFDLSDLEEKSERLVEVVDARVAELDSATPDLGVRDYLDRLSDEFDELVFEPLDELWEEELRRLFDDDAA